MQNVCVTGRGSQVWFKCCSENWIGIFSLLDWCSDKFVWNISNAFSSRFSSFLFYSSVVIYENWMVIFSLLDSVVLNIQISWTFQNVFVLTILYFYSSVVPKIGLMCYLFRLCDSFWKNIISGIKFSKRFCGHASRFLFTCVFMQIAPTSVCLQWHFSLQDCVSLKTSFWNNMFFVLRLSIFDFLCHGSRF